MSHGNIFNQFLVWMGDKYCSDSQPRVFYLDYTTDLRAEKASIGYENWMDRTFESCSQYFPAETGSNRANISTIPG